MAGITNYFHSETGSVIDNQYIAEAEVRVLRLREDPHRESVYAYGGDIHIDPLLKTGDKAGYIRTDPYGGIWVRERNQYYPELQQAIDRVIEERNRLLEKRIDDRAREDLFKEARSSIDNRPSERPATEASFFLSFSSKNVLARQIFNALKHDAKVEVWFDLDQEG